MPPTTRSTAPTSSSEQCPGDRGTPSVPTRGGVKGGSGGAEGCRRIRAGLTAQGESGEEHELQHLRGARRPRWDRGLLRGRFNGEHRGEAREGTQVPRAHGRPWPLFQSTHGTEAEAPRTPRASLGSAAQADAALRWPRAVAPSSAPGHGGSSAWPWLLRGLREVDPTLPGAAGLGKWRHEQGRSFSPPRAPSAGAGPGSASPGLGARGSSDGA